MNGYLVLYHLTEVEQTDAQWADFIATLTAGGHLIGGSALAKPSAIERGTGATPTSQTVGGYMVLKAASEADIQSLVKLSPCHANGGLVEIFALV